MLSARSFLSSPSRCLSRRLLLHTSTTSSSSSVYSPGAVLGSDKSWTVERVDDVKEFDLRAIQMKHKHSGAVFTHLQTDDQVNAFSVNFKTTPMDSTGISHILEHTTLCGSKLYPVRDPFFKMLNRSLSTFMNAMTGPDYTLYPFSTANEKDYYNLMSVYLDAVFRPNLKQQDFRQEGWRLEPEDLSKPDSAAPIIKGVVFNEMKGVFADPQQLFARHLLSAVLPGHTYGHCSGGLPEKIPDLTWENLRLFHSRHYSPQNACFFTYGNLPVEPHLEFVKNYLPGQKETAAYQVPDVPNESKWSSPRSVDIACAPDPSNPKGLTVAVSYLMCDINDYYETFVLGIIGELLIDGSNAPFYKSLLEPGLGQSFAPSTGYDPHTKDTLFTIGLQGIESGKKEEVVEAIKKTFEKASEDGFEQDRIDAIMHRTELALKNKGNNFGLNLIMALTPAANHSKTDFFQSMHVNQKVERFRKEMAMNPNYLQEKVKQYFVNNSHRLLMSMSPEEDYTNKQEEVLEAVRTRLVEKLTPGERDGLVIAGKELAEVQSLKEDLSCLPTLKVTDIVQSQSRYALQRTNRCSVPAQVSQQPTNEVAFFRAMLSTQDVPLDLLEMLPLFTGILSSMGAGKFDFRQMDTLVDLTTGGLSSSVHVTELPGSCAALNEAVLISSYCLERNVDKMFELWTEIFNDLHLNDGNIDRLKTLLRMSATDSMNGLVYRGHAYAMGSSASSLQPGASIREDYGGMVALKRLQELAKLDDLTGVAGKLRSLADIVMTKNRMKVALNTTEQFGDRMLEATSNFAGSVRGDFSAFEPSDKTDFKAATLKQYFSTPFPVNYCSMSLPTVPYAHSDFAPLRILARLMSKQFLHTEIREKGGAYGGGATANSSGTFSFYSYRDPNTTKTLETFDASADWVQKTVFSQQDLDEAKLGVFQTVDEPTPPGSRGMREFLSDVDDDMFESQRRQLREVTIEDVKRVSDKYLSNGAAKRGVSVIGPEPKEGSLDESWVVQQLV